MVDIPKWEGACFHIDLPLQDSELQHPPGVEDFEHPEFQELSGSYQVFEHPSGKTSENFACRRQSRNPRLCRRPYQ